MTLGGRREAGWEQLEMKAQCSQPYFCPLTVCRGFGAMLS